jgi:hypothetical protein
MQDPVIRNTALRVGLPPRRQPPGAVRQKIAFGYAMEDIGPLTELAAAVSGEEYGEQRRLGIFPQPARVAAQTVTQKPAVDRLVEEVVHSAGQVRLGAQRITAPD